MSNRRRGFTLLEMRVYPVDTDTRPDFLGATHAGMRSGFWFQASGGSANGGGTLAPND